MVISPFCDECFHRKISLFLPQIRVLREFAAKGIFQCPLPVYTGKFFGEKFRKSGILFE